MLFNSHEFISLFLPVTILIFFVIGKRGLQNVAITWLVLASLFFYGWWNPAYLTVIVASIIFNFATGLLLAKKAHPYQIWTSSSQKALLVFGVSVNLLVLGYFKYANFFLENISFLTGQSYHLDKIILPLGISFFTFQQITYLVDASKGATAEYSFLHYCLFVTFFPQLIAGPIVHHKEMLPQFTEKKYTVLHMKILALVLPFFLLVWLKRSSWPIEWR